MRTFNAVTERGGMSSAGSRRRVNVALLISIMAVFMIVPSIISLPVPDHEVGFHNAQLKIGMRDTETVSLPHRWALAPATGPFSATFTLSFNSSDLPDRSVLLFIPALRQAIDISLNGTQLRPLSPQTWSDARSGFFHIAPVPPHLIMEGENEIEIRQTRGKGWMAGYLSAAYLVTDEQVSSYEQVLDFLMEQWRAMTFALHLMVLVGFLSIMAVRRHDPVLCWLTTLVSISMFVVMSQIPIITDLIGPWKKSLLFIMSSVGLTAVGTALAVARIARPRTLFAAVAVVPAVLAAYTIMGNPLAPALAVSAVILIVGNITAAFILGSAYADDATGWEAPTLAFSFALTGCFAASDLLMALGLNGQVFALTPYGRTVTLVAITIILMGRLAQSLNKLDNATETLSSKLAEREVELGKLYQQKRAREHRRVLEQERQRLMSDLHDGIGGHLISLIMLTENSQGKTREANLTARAALADLRQVVDSLDLGDADLRVALEGQHERLLPQLRRLGVELDWSITDLPEIGGLTPANGLALQRIVQEAVTNAIKHGPACRIRIRAMTGEHNGAIITIENDCNGPGVEGGGKGLENMRKRAESLGGALNFTISKAEGRAVLSLYLPRHLLQQSA